MCVRVQMNGTKIAVNTIQQSSLRETQSFMQSRIWGIRDNGF